MLEAERQARLAGVTSLAQLARICRALAAFYAGDFDGSLAMATAAPRDEIVAAGVEMQWHATRAYVLSRLGRHAEAQAAAATEVAAAARLDQPIREAHAAQDAGAVALAAGDGAAARAQLAIALELGGGSIRRPLARLQLAEACLLEGDLDGAAAELGRVPFEPVRPVDLPATLVPRMSRLQGLIAAARGDDGLALRRLGEARRRGGTGSATTTSATAPSGRRSPTWGACPSAAWSSRRWSSAACWPSGPACWRLPGAPRRPPAPPARRSSSPTPSASTATAPRPPPSPTLEVS